MTVWLVLIPAFIAAFSGAFLALFLLRTRQPAQAALAPADAASPLLRHDFHSTITFWNHILERLDFIHIVKKRTEEAQLQWSLGRITAMMLLSGAIAYAILRHIVWLPGVALAGGIVLGAALPYLYIERRRARRLTRFAEEFPDALDSMCRALKAGNPLSAAVEMLAWEGAPPVSTEMKRVWDEWNLGAAWDTALDNLAGRVPIPEVSQFAAAVKLHNKTGGKLSQVLATLAESMRESNALQGEIRAVAAHGKITAAILTTIPAVIAFLMNLVNPSHLEVLYQHPVGKDLIGVALGCIVAAHFVMRKILEIRP